MKDEAADKAEDAKEVAEDEELKEYTYANGFRDKFIYFFSLGFGGFLFLYVMPLVSLPRVVAEHSHNANFKPEFMILMVTAGGDSRNIIKYTNY
mgnify:CR=1 FL=1